MAHDSPPSMPCLQRLRDENRTAALAHDDASALPDDLRREGEAAIDALAAHLLEACFPGVGEADEAGRLLQAGGDLDWLLELLDLRPLLPVIAPRLASWTPRSYLQRCVSELKKNPILVLLGAEWAAQPLAERAASTLSVSARSPGGAAELRRVVVYSALLDALAHRCLHEPKPAPTSEARSQALINRLLKRLRRQKEQRDWEKFANTFEILKVKLVYKPMIERVAAKLGDDTMFDDEAGDGTNLQANILDAMYGDTMSGRDDNAAAGFELMCQTYDKATNAATGEDLIREWVNERGERMGVPLLSIAFGRAWANLFTSWNGAFCSSYREAPFFWAKLYQPTTAGTYHTVHPGLFIPPRGLCLFVHIHTVILARDRLGRRDFSELPWASDRLTELWGQINLAAAQAYQQRVQQAMEAAGQGPSYAAWRAAKKSLWTVVREMSRLGRLLGQGSDEVAAIYRQKFRRQLMEDERGTPQGNPEKAPPGSPVAGDIDSDDDVQHAY